MKKNLLKYSVVLILIILCSGCDGNVTRDIRHAGFNVSSKFVCNSFYPENKEDTNYKKIKYFTDTHLIDENGELYELSLGQLYQNNQNCKKADTELEVKAILDNKIIKATDNKYYYLVKQNNVDAYTEITDTDNSYYIYDLLLKDQDVLKVITADNSIGLYYILKVDGNVYANMISSQDRNSLPVVISTQIVYNYNDFDGSRIIDFNYAGDSLLTYIRTEDKVYRMRITNSEECSKYSDIACQYEMQEDSVFEKYKDRIITYNGSLLITDYKQVFTVAK